MHKHFGTQINLSIYVVINVQLMNNVDLELTTNLGFWWYG